jgi:hypothetical protein
LIFKFACPKCKQRLEVPGEMAGQPVVCPACAHQFSIPIPASQGGRKPAPLVRLKPPPPKKPKPLAALSAEPEAETGLRSPAEPERDIDKEVADLLALCDPDRFGLDEPAGDQPPADESAALPEARPPADQPAETGGGRAPWERKPIWLVAVVASILAVALLVGGGIWLVSKRHPPKPPNRRIVQLDTPDGSPAEEDEGTCFRKLGTMVPGDVPATEERAKALLDYLARFPDGTHRREVLVFAAKEAARALEIDDELPEPAVSLYAQVGRIATEEILLQPPADRQESMDVVARFAVRLCWHARDPKNLASAKRVIEADDEAPERNAEVCLAALANDTPAEYREEFEQRLYQLALETQPRQWSRRWVQVAGDVAQRLAQDPNSGAQRLIRFAVGLHEGGWEAQALDLMRRIAQTSLSGDGREVARRWWLCWDPAEAAKVRSSVLARAEAEYRRQLPGALKAIDRPKLAARLGLPWPVPPSPTVTPAQAIEARMGGVAEAVDREFPESRLTQTAAEIAQRYVPYRIGEQLTLRIQRGVVRETVNGRYYSRTVSHVRIGDRDVGLADLGEDDRIRFDPKACEKERRDLVEAQRKAFTKRRNVYRERLLANVRAEAPAAAGYVWRGDAWQDPQVIYSQGLNEAAESVSEALRTKVMEDMLAQAGFEPRDGQWVPIPPKVMK